MEDAPTQWNTDIEDLSGACSDCRRGQLGKDEYDVVIVGAGCVGCSVARELSRFCLKVLVLEAADDVTQGATKGNSGIVHAGYDDAPGSVRAKFCPKGNRMFPDLDRDLKFGFQLNGSLVVARQEGDEAILEELLERGNKNGVEGLRILDQEELRRVEPNVNPDATKALFAPSAGIVIPFEFTIALAENASMNGVEFRTRRTVTNVQRQAGSVEDRIYRISAQRWFLRTPFSPASPVLLGGVALLAALAGGLVTKGVLPAPGAEGAVAVLGAILGAGFLLLLVVDALMRQPGTKEEVVTARFVVNSAGLFSDKVARMVGDESFYIKPRIGEYLLGKRPDITIKENPPHCRHIVFPCPGKMGKGILVQPTLWGNLCLGPTAHDFEDREWRVSVHDPKKRGESKAGIMEELLVKCRELFPKHVDMKDVIHSFAGVRAKNSTGDWIVRCSEGHDGRFVHAAGIDSPGLAGSPAIALEVVRLLREEGGCELKENAHFNPKRKPYIIPKGNWTVPNPQGGKQLPIKKDHADPALNVICRCELVTESEIVDAITRGKNGPGDRAGGGACGGGIPVDTTQAVRKRTRAGMGWCQGQYCQPRVQKILARELNKPVGAVPVRAWPESSLLDGQHQFAEKKK